MVAKKIAATNLLDSTQAILHRGVEARQTFHKTFQFSTYVALNKTYINDYIFCLSNTMPFRFSHKD